MKNLLFTLLILSSPLTHALEKTFSAFIDENKLHITVNLDTCNNHQLHIKAHPSCSPNMTARYVTECELSFAISSTKMACQGGYLEKTLSYPIEKLNLQKSITTLAVQNSEKTAKVVLPLPEETPKTQEPSEGYDYLNAIVIKDYLYISTFVDSCNSHSLNLIIPNHCKDIDLTPVFQPFQSLCPAQVQILSTRKYCSKQRPVLKTFEVPIESLQLNAEIQTLSLTHSPDDEPVKVNIK